MQFSRIEGASDLDHGGELKKFFTLKKPITFKNSVTKSLSRRNLGAPGELG
jgi:hypothetical protein